MAGTETGRTLPGVHDGEGKKAHVFSKGPGRIFFSLMIPQSAPFMDDLTTNLLLFNVFIIFSNSTKFYLF